jgi:hypothetical protein
LTELFHHKCCPKRSTAVRRFIWLNQKFNVIVK